MALDLRPNREFCHKDLPRASMKARIRRDECTFCAECAERTLLDVCPNRDGGFAPHPARPLTERPPGLSVARLLASTKRCHLRHSLRSIAEYSARARKVVLEMR